ncbi:Flp pilus assembly protein CpaB [Clostridiales bacterium oral taxon 876 str. F0540]|nr:Flp pilus assembly protein CpaB [Clostridiales bacterium oral taxon 876 str. F0540]
MELGCLSNVEKDVTIMKSSGSKIIIASFILALFAAITIFMYLQSIKSPKTIAKKTTVLVAADTIQPRTLINKDMVKEVQVSDSTLFSDYVNDSSKVIGKYTKETIMKNEGFHKDKLINNDEEELSLKIDKDHRAISVNVMGDAGVAYLIKPSDFVDIVVYLSEKSDGTKAARPDVAKIILQNIEVLAVNKQLDREVNKDNKDAQKDQAAYLVTLSVETKSLEKIVLAESIGTIKLALRPLKDDSTVETNGTTWKEFYIRVDGTEDIQSGNKEGADNNNQSAGTSNNSGDTTYTVKRGDTLRKISSQVYGDPSKYSLIKKANNINDEDIIVIGEVLKIPKLK